MKLNDLPKSATPSVGCPFSIKKVTSSSAEEVEKLEECDSTSTSRWNSDASLSSSDATSCPFAQSLHNHDVDDSSSSTSTDSSAISAMLSSPPSPGVAPTSPVPWKECPAFAKQSCPFRDVKSTDDVSQILMRLPASHINKSLPTHAVLIETLAYFHRDKAMEEYSFSSMMSKLAREHDSRTETLNGDISISGEGGLGMDADEFQISLLDHGKNDNENQERSVQSVPLPAKISENSCQPQKQGRRLSEALKTGTEEAHKEAESVHFVKNFIRGKIDRGLYALFVAQMFHVYRRLETELDKHASQNFPDCHFPKELNRSEALQDDIDFWQGSSDEPPISPATQDYLDRITTVAKERPLLLLAHAYTRYLGDLSGGKILARVAKKALLLGSGNDGATDGLAFYDFPMLRGSVKAFKDRYRQALNDLQFQDVDEAFEAIVQEANVAFLLNMRLFEELDVIGSVPGASVRPIDQVYSHAASMKIDHKSEKVTQKEHVPPQCPFANMSGASAFQHLHDHESSKYEEKEQNKIETRSCPWPFILLHNPNAGMRQWQTWAAFGLFLMYTYQQLWSHYAQEGTQL